MDKTLKPASFGFAAATLLGALLLAAPLAPAAAQDQSSTAAAPAAAPAHHARAHRAAERTPEEIEAHIADLKAKLKITDAQATQWNAVAQVMRDNAADAKAKAEARNATATATAVDDLKTYEAMAEGHAEGLKKMVTAFEALYNAMSDDQKKNADQVFAQHEGRGEHHRAPKK